jgi:hypothetical protein
MIQTHDLGDERDLRSTWTIEGVATDPTSVVFSIKEPDSAVTTYTSGIDQDLVRTDAGVFRVLWVVRKAGWHFARFPATGNIVQSQDIVFYCRPSPTLGMALPTPPPQ